MDISMLVSWLDVGEIIIFALLLWWVYRRGVKDGVLKEQERILMDWVKKQLESQDKD